MDFLLEFLGELLFETPVYLAMESKRVKCWLKTLLFCLIGGAVDALFIVVCIGCWQDWEITVRCVMSALTLGWTLVIIFGVLRGHRRKWKI